MHESVIAFGQANLRSEMVKGKRVLEVGSLNVNGSLRAHVEGMEPASYIGIDLREGPGVDHVVDFCALTEELVLHKFGHTFDLIISTEMLEHAENWRAAIYNMKALLKPGGVILLTTRSVGFPRHGYPSDYWRFSPEDMSKIFADYNGITCPDPQVPGVFIQAVKSTGDVPAVDLSKIEVHSMNPPARPQPPIPLGKTRMTSTRASIPERYVPRLGPNKIYYFICSDCGERKPHSEECGDRGYPGVCQHCYQTLERYRPVDTPRLAGMLRVRNESRWIERVIKSIAPLCNGGIFILDDKSTDNTPELARQCGATVILSNAPGIDETRDKNALLKSIMELSNPDWVLHIDGDEEMEPAGVEVIRQAIRDHKAQTFSLPILYLWDRENQIRVDGIYGRFARESLFATANTNGIFRPTAHGMGTTANLHCSNVPADLAKGAVALPGARLIHYGYIDRAMRLKKWDFYNTVDPDNLLEDRYRHAVTGDIPEVPANVRTKYAGPLKLQPYFKWVGNISSMEDFKAVMNG
jgi:Methyltransferase domain/Glycosyl transferase family 2